jgi:hypothetical protein
MPLAPKWLAQHEGHAHLLGTIESAFRGRTNMAKGQKRSGREAKKPKQVKKPAPVAGSPVAVATAKGKPGSGR